MCNVQFVHHLESLSGCLVCVWSVFNYPLLNPRCDWPAIMPRGRPKRTRPARGRPYQTRSGNRGDPSPTPPTTSTSVVGPTAPGTEQFLRWIQDAVHQQIQAAGYPTVSSAAIPPATLPHVTSSTSVTPGPSASSIPASSAGKLTGCVSCIPKYASGSLRVCVYGVCMYICGCVCVCVCIYTRIRVCAPVYVFLYYYYLL